MIALEHELLGLQGTNLVLCQMLIEHDRRCRRTHDYPCIEKDWASQARCDNGGQKVVGLRRRSWGQVIPWRVSVHPRCFEHTAKCLYHGLRVSSYLVRQHTWAVWLGADHERCE